MCEKCTLVTDNKCSNGGSECATPLHLSGYARPRTRGELRDLLNSGVACEVVSSVAPMTGIMLMGWLNFKGFLVRPSENEGWSVFERA